MMDVGTQQANKSILPGSRWWMPSLSLQGSVLGAVTMKADWTLHIRYSEEAHRLHQDPDQPNAQRQSIHGSHQVNQSREKARNPDGMRRDQAWLALQLEAWARARHRRAGAGDLDLDSRTRPRRHWAP